jgi:hypothetical protein
VSSHARSSWTASLSSRNDEIASPKRDHSVGGPRAALRAWTPHGWRWSGPERDLTSARLANDRTAPQRRAIAGGECATPSWSTRRGARYSSGDLDKERELAGAEGNTGGLLEDRCAALTREMTELEELAREATEGATEHAQEARERLAWAVNEAVRAAREGGVEARGGEGARAAGHGGKGADGVNHLGGGGRSPRRRARMIEGGGDGAGDPRIPMPLRVGDGPLGAQRKWCLSEFHRTGNASTSGEIRNLNLLHRFFFRR